ncbi:MAG: hypothetical protein HC912_05790 [Saprospiraceae bacterium]|nr:hypothetical protein [Saprospiraceae bacterium]
MELFDQVYAQKKEENTISKCEEKLTQLNTNHKKASKKAERAAKKFNHNITQPNRRK